MNNQYINNLMIEIDGASHSKEIKLIVKGLPKETIINRELIEKNLNYRQGNPLISTPRREPNEYWFKSGVIDDIIIDDTVEIIVPNKNYNDEPYQTPSVVRPGHADLVQYIKSNGTADLRGGGIASGRMTTPLVILGSICEQILNKKGIKVASRIKQIANIIDESNPTIDESLFEKLDTDFPSLTNKEKMIEAIKKAKDKKDSIGGIIETYSIGLPIGIGEPFFQSFESNLSHLIFSIPGINGIEFGEGFNTTNFFGSTYNDEPKYLNNILTYKTNHSGGLSGGMTNGNVLTFKTSIRPPSSIGLKQETVDLKTKENTTIEIKGAHDSCFVHRALHVINAVTYITIFDQLSTIHTFDTIEANRNRIDQLDNQIMNLLNERFNITSNIGRIKNEQRIEKASSKREAQILKKANNLENGKYIKNIYQNIFEESKKQQAKYQLVAGNSGYSYSKQIHNLFNNKDYEMNSTWSLGYHIGKLFPLGINVTNPFKREAFFLCYDTDAIAKKHEIVNLMVKDENGYFGYNTDYTAFLNSLKYYNIDVTNKNVTLVGNGSTAKTIEALLIDQKVNHITKLVRHIKNENEILLQDAPFDEKCDIIINATPFGVHPNLEIDSLVDFNNYSNAKYAIDVNYNPLNSGFLQNAKAKGLKIVNGLYMLVENGRISETLWQKKDISEDLTKSICKEIEKNNTNIVIIGQSLAGKSTIGKQLSKYLQKDLWDNDFELQKANLDLKDKKDIEKFRDNEALYLTNASLLHNTVIVPGAGAIQNNEVFQYLKQNSLIIYLDASIDVLKKRLETNNRPLLTDVSELERLYQERLSKYENIADIKIEINDKKDKDEILKEIMVKLNEYYDRKWS